MCALRYRSQGADANIDEALKDLDSVIRECYEVIRNRITLTAEAYGKAKELLGAGK
jgi:hypothetical protein